MLLFFIILQIILLFFIVFHDWIPIPPLNDVKTLKQIDGNRGRLIASAINGFWILVPLIITIKGYFFPLSSIGKTTVFLFYFSLSIGTILSWWKPYFFGSSTKHKQAFHKFKHTHHFLPARGTNVIPNTLHVILHIQIWLCFCISVWLLV